MRVGRFGEAARLVAGAPLADDVLKCQLKPVDSKDDKGTMTTEEAQQLRQVFTGGVCDYSKAGVNQQPLSGTYLKLPLVTPLRSSTAAGQQH